MNVNAMLKEIENKTYTNELEINNSCSYKNKDTINETNNNAKSVQEINFIDIEAVPIVLSDNALIYDIDNSAYVINDVNIKDNSISIDTTNKTEINKTYVDDLEMDNNITYENNKTIDKTNEILDLSFIHRRNCSTTLYQFLQQPPIPERKGKKFTQRKSYAISSLQWKINEKKKLPKRK